MIVFKFKNGFVVRYKGQIELTFKEGFIRVAASGVENKEFPFSWDYQIYDVHDPNHIQSIRGEDNVKTSDKRQEQGEVRKTIK